VVSFVRRRSERVRRGASPRRIGRGCWWNRKLFRVCLCLLHARPCSRRQTPGLQHWSEVSVRVLSFVTLQPTPASFLVPLVT